LKSSKYAYICDNTQVAGIPIEDPKYSFDGKRWNSEMITGGLIYQFTTNALLTVGGGYAKRDYLREIVTDEVFNTGNNREWCLNKEASYNGVTIEIGGAFKYKYFTLLAGVNSCKFKDLDIYIGIAYSF